ncbi:MAG: DUF3568 family protein, partial [Acidithiobacillus sp.]
MSGKMFPGGRWALIALGCAAVAMPLSGCVALLGAGAGGGAVAYVENGGIANYYAYYPVSLQQASTASQATLQQMGIAYNGNIRKTPNEELMEGTTSTGKTVKITFTSMSTQVTKVNVRVGTFGDKALSLQFQKLLSQHLGMAASAVAPASAVPSEGAAPPAQAQQ